MTRNLPGRFRKVAILSGFALAFFFFLNPFFAHSGMAETRVRFLHLSPDTGPVEVFVGGRRIEEQLHFSQYTDYLQLTAGQHRITCKSTEEGDDLILNTLYPFREDRDYSVILTGESQAEDSQLFFVIDSCEPSERMASLNFANLAADLGILNLSIKYGPTLYEGHAFLTSGGCRRIPPGNHSLLLTEKTSGKSILEKEVNFSPGKRYNIFAIQTRIDREAQLLILDQENLPEEAPQVLGVERSLLQLFGAGLIVSILIVALGQ